MNTMIPVENGDALSAVRGFLRQLLQTGAVEALFVPMEAGSGPVIPALVTNPDRLSQANPLAPVMPINSARAVASLTGKHSPARLGVVLRSCEIRALVELVKLQQATLEGVTLIALDCPGTFELVEYVKVQQNGGFDLASYLAAAKEAREPDTNGLSLRPACQACSWPVPERADIHLHLFGVDTASAIPVTVRDEIASGLSLMEVPDAGVSERREVTGKLIAARSHTREKELAAMQAQLTVEGGMAALFAACIRCHNCMTVCPICYCKTCLFKSPAFDHPPEHYLKAARHKGAVRLLGDTWLFHLTRLNHMSVSCVSCGMCTSACPADIPVGMIFSSVGDQVQAAFDYLPGRSVEEPLPLITFQANEWMEIGEEK